MDRKTKRSVAVVAGLTAVLALSPVAGPLTTALADETTSVDSTVASQTNDGISTRSFFGWHYGNFDYPHLYIGTLSGTCFCCGAPYWDGCKPGHDGDDQKPGQGGDDQKPGCGDTEQMETLTVIFHFADGATQTVEVETPTGTTVLFQTFVDKLDDQYDGITWYWTEFSDDDNPVLPNNHIGGQGSHTINVYERKADVTDPDSGTDPETPDTEEPGGDTEKPDTEEPGTGTENPGTDTEQPGTDTEEPGTDTETPGTDTEEPGTDTETPGTDTETPDADDDTDVVTPNDNADASDDAADATDKSDDASKKADETTNEDKSAAEDKSTDEDALPSTGDASMAISGIAALGTAVAGLGAFLRRRR